MKKHVMLDLETMGTSSNAAIVEIGAVEFDPCTGDLGTEFQTIIHLKSAAHYGDIDASTVEFWMQQNEYARQIFQKDTIKATLPDALCRFNQWLDAIAPKKDIYIWGNGAGFDNVVLKNAYEKCQIEAGFSHWNDLDVRTIVRMGRDILEFDPKNTTTRKGVHHSALDDAKFQVEYVSEIWHAFSYDHDMASIGA